ncbi:Cyclin domain containing protein [Amanita muscaria]
MLALVHPSPAHPPAIPRTRPRHPPPEPKPEHCIQQPPNPSPDPVSTLDIDSYPPQKLLKLLASLLTQIASTNDALSPAASPTTSSSIHTIPMSSVTLDNPLWRSLTTASRSALSTHSATLTFHARNIPTISLEAYLLRILKYCPTTNQVFLSLLVYFDRMSKLTLDATTRIFVIDSYNIHRLVIAGVTVASKFFSDVFYTNSRYAKVGGLPLTELNQLELQFLLLNDFRLVISSSEMQRYAEQLILFSQSHTDYVSPLSLSIPSTSAQDQLLLVTPVSQTQSTTLPSAPPMISSSHRHQQVTDNQYSSQPHTTQTPSIVDPYGGRVHNNVPNGYAAAQDHQHSHLSQHNGPSLPSHSVGNGSINVTPNGRLVRRDSASADDTETENETETGTETGTETDADADDTSTTDDEPTVRPGRMSIASSVYSVASVSSVGSGSSGSRNGSGESAVNGRVPNRGDAESDVCSVRSFDTGDEGGDEYENDDEMDEDPVPPSSAVNGRGHVVVDDGERTPEMGIKLPLREFFNDAKAQRALDGHLNVDWEGDMRMRSPKP